jgi:hypothetical protein
VVLDPGSIIITDDLGKFVFNSVPEKTWWNIVVRYNNSDVKSSGRGMIDPDKNKDTIFVYGAKIDYQTQPLR